MVSNNATLSKGFKDESNSEPMSIYEGTISIENHTTYVLHVTIHVGIDCRGSTVCNVNIFGG